MPAFTTKIYGMKYPVAELTHIVYKDKTTVTYGGTNPNGRGTTTGNRRVDSSGNRRIIIV